jgi:hypothetical protein
VKKSTQTLLWVGAGAAVLYYLYTKNQTAATGAVAPQLTQGGQATCCGGVCKVAQVSNAISCLFANV